LKGHFEELKIREGHLDVHEKAIELKMDDLVEGLGWLRVICHNQHSELVKAKNLLSPDQWRRYELWGDDFNEHQEVLILKKAQVELRRVLTSQDRPNLFKKGYVDGQLKDNEKAIHKNKQQRKARTHESAHRQNATGIHADERNRE